MKLNCLTILLAILLPLTGICDDHRWKIQDDGSIKWTIAEDVPHHDHIEMSGDHVSTVLRYGVDTEGAFVLERSIIWPMLRTIPNNTHASLTRRFAVDFMSLLSVNNLTLAGESVKSIQLDGTLTVESEYAIVFRDMVKGERRHPILHVTRQIFPSTTKPLVGEQYTLRNTIDQPITVTVPEYRNVYRTVAEQGVNGSYTIVVALDNPGTTVLQPGETMVFHASIQAYAAEKGEQELRPVIPRELAARKQFLDTMWSDLVLETPVAVIDRAFAFAKIRASESVYRTAGGLMHGPGGEAYYAAIWANDESEYVAPFFPLLGYQVANEATLNAFRLYMAYMNDEYRAVPSSIIAEGTDTWQGAGDCGDAAMLAYGGTRYALARGSMEEAKFVWPLMEWSLEYCHRNLNAFGVVKSDSDELENRFPSGDANILVSSLYYDALISASFLAKELGLAKNQVRKYQQRAKALKAAIEQYFGANVEGFDTYSYYKGNDQLRSWICAPLFAGIQDRAEATVEALFSKLWTPNGLLSQSGTDVFWDRSTLSALRAVYVAGETEQATRYLKAYSEKRLLGDHVPYPIEAWPEGNQRHLSGESALYCRVITEGLIGIRPIGFKSFTLAPRLPQGWDRMALRNIRGFGATFDVQINRSGKKIAVVVTAGDRTLKQQLIDEGSELTIQLLD